MQQSSPDLPDIPTTPVRRQKAEGSSVVQQLLTAEAAAEPMSPPAPAMPAAPAAPVTPAAPPAPAACSVPVRPLARASKPPVTPTPMPPTPPPPPRPPASLLVSCPRCEAKLIDPDCMALCPKCGWCRALEEAAYLDGEEVRPVQRRSLLGSMEFLELLWKSPGWTWVLIGGMLAAVLSSAVANGRLPPQGMVRALWTTGQIGFGLVLIMAAQACALVLLAPQDERLSSKDLFLSGRLWGLILKRLPETQWYLAIAMWGLTLAVSAVIWIGGLSFWLPVNK